MCMLTDLPAGQHTFLQVILAYLVTPTVYMGQWGEYSTI